MIAHDSRRYHARRNPERLRAYGKQQASTSIGSPYGGLPFRTAGQISRQQLSPLLMGLGLGTGKKAQRLQEQIMSGKAQGPLASAIRQIQQYAPGVISGATDIGQQVATQGGQAVDQLRQAIAAAQGQLPGWQQAGQAGLTAAEQGLTGAQDLYRQMQGLFPGLQQAGQQGMSAAQQALTAAQGALGGPAQQGAQAALARAQQLLSGGTAQAGAEQGVNLAQRFAQQMASPIQGEDLYQQAARRVMQQVGAGAAARGLEGGGAATQAQYEAMTNLAGQMAQQQAANRQAALQGLAGATGNLGNLQQAAIGGAGQAAGTLGNITQQAISGLTGAGQGVQQAAQGQAAIGGSLLPFLQALQQGGQNVQQAAQGAAGIGMLGPQLAGQQAQAINQLGQTLMQQYGLPMQATGQLLNILTAGVSPGLQMLEATRPLALPSSKGTQIL